jgi:hypothetical protein
VDLTNPDNAGLVFPIQSLESIVAKHGSLQIGFSQPDIWAQMALIGANVAQADSKEQ